MQIDSANIGQAQITQTQQAAATSETKHARGGHRHSDGSDRIQISDLTTQLAAQASSSDTQKIDQLKAAYESGTYNIAPDKIAASMIDDASKL